MPETAQQTDAPPAPAQSGVDWETGQPRLPAEADSSEGETREPAPRQPAPRQPAPAAGFDAVTFLRSSLKRMRQDLDRERERNRQLQRDNDGLRAGRYKAVTEARREVEEREKESRRQLTEDLRKEERRADGLERQVERMEHEKQLEEKFEREFGQKADSSILDLVMGLVEQHGNDYVQQVLAIFKAQVREAQSASQVQQAQQATSAAALESVMAELETASGDGQASGQASGDGQQASPPAPPTPTPQRQPAPPQQQFSEDTHDDSRSPMAHRQRSSDMPTEATESTNARQTDAAGVPARDGSQVTAAAPSSQDADAQGSDHAGETITETFARRLSERAEDALESKEAAGDFASAARGIIAQLESEGYTHGVDGFVALTERLVPKVAPEGYGAHRVAELLAPFLTDLKGMARVTFKNTGAQTLKTVFIDPNGVDLAGHDDFLIDVLRELKTYL